MKSYKLSAIQFHSCEILHDDFGTVPNRGESPSTVYEAYKCKGFLPVFLTGFINIDVSMEFLWHKKYQYLFLSSKSTKDNLPLQMPINSI